MTISTLIIILLILALIGVLPAWPHSAAWGRGPASILGVVLVVVILLLVTGLIR